MENEVDHSLNYLDMTVIGSRDSLVGIATGYGLHDQGQREFESRSGKTFSLLHIVQTGSGVHPTSYIMGTGGSFPGIKRQGHEADHSTPTGAEVKKKNVDLYIHSPIRLHGVMLN
jgi:hypothetical protein